MRYINYALLLLLIFSTPDLFGQSGEEVEMADILRKDGKIYTVVLGIVLILTGMIILLIRVDRKIFRLEKDLNRGRVNKEV